MSPYTPFKNPKIRYAFLTVTMRSLIPLLVLIPTIATAQVAERIEVSVVNVDVAVTGANGAPVRGLTRDDFQIFEDGTRQAITNFYVVSSGGVQAADSGLKPAATPEAPDFRRRVLVLVDVFHTSKNRRALALASLERMIDDSFQSGEYDWSIGILGRGVTTVLPLTSDKAAIHATLARMLQISERVTPALAADRLTGMPRVTNPDAGKFQFDLNTDIALDRALSFDEENRVRRAQFTVKAIVDTVKGFASTLGKKIVLLLTGDLGLNDIELTDDNFNSGGGAFFQKPMGSEFDRLQREIAQLRTSMIHEANASGVSMYIFNVEGLNPNGDLGANPTPVTNTAAAFWLSKETGGRLVTGNDAALALQQFDSASANYYSLGYRPPHAGDGKYHAIEVRLKNAKGAKMDYRSGYSSSTPLAELARAMDSPVAPTLLTSTLPVTLIAGEQQQDRRGVAVPITVKVPFSALQFLPADRGVSGAVRIFVSVFDDVGKKLFSGSFPLPIRLPEARPQETMVYKNMVVLGRGVSVRIVAAVRDETSENVGLAEINVTTR